MESLSTCLGAAPVGLAPRLAAQAPATSISCLPLSTRRTLSLSLFQSRTASRPRVSASVAVTSQPITENGAGKVDEKEEEQEEESPFEPTETGADPPSPFEVQSLLMEICDETDIAEFRIKVGEFLLHVKRDLGGPTPAPHSASYYAPPPVPVAAVAASPAAAAPSRPTESAAEDAVDEGLLYVTSPSVGVLRRGREVKGKRGPELVSVGSEVEAGEVVCYIQQLTSEVAVESQHAGEVVKFLVNDGDAVGYADAIIAVRPSFPGIKKLA